MSELSNDKEEGKEEDGIQNEPLEPV